LLIFFIGYFFITVEHYIKINKAAFALLIAALSWVILMLNSQNYQEVNLDLNHHLVGVSEIVFFLLGAMTIVEIIDAHDGFSIISQKIKTNKKNQFIWLIALFTFFLSAILDNLTTTIVMVTILNKLVADRKTKWLLLGLVIISSNAGGAFSPIGDVTTTMLWIGGQITPLNIIKETFLASAVAMIVPTLIISYLIKGNITLKNQSEDSAEFKANSFQRNFILLVGILSLLFVPIFKVITHLPPYMGMFCSLGILWVITELMHKGNVHKNYFTVSKALEKIDTPSILFFFGILMSIAALESAHILPGMANLLNEIFKGDINLIAISIGLLSSLFDNVPLVAALQSMYSLDVYHTDHYFWELLAFTAGTGGSCLIIGSAAGVAVMGMEKIDFIWYLKNISWIAFIGFITGAMVLIFEANFLHWF
ncbi:MAG: sodium:proton antiporter NhaD, partial [Chitinophagaceae bacterium]